MAHVIPEQSKVAVAGAGTMGSGIAQVAAMAGHLVVVIDAKREALDRSARNWRESLARFVERGRLRAAEAADLEPRIRWATGFDEIEGAALAIEAIVEDVDVKAALLADLEGRLPDGVIATNTSSLSIASLAARLGRPERFIGMHFFNPAPAMRLVEVVPSDQTDPAVTEAIVDLAGRWGKSAVRVKDVPGFIVNRVARPYYAEGFAALDEGWAPADIDQALTQAGGFRMGPLELADLIGHDVNYAVACSVFEAYGGRTRFRPQPAQARLVAQGRLGRKSGAGIYGSERPAGRDESGVMLAGRVARAPMLGPLSSLVETMPEITIDATLAAGLVEVDGVAIACHDGRRATSLSARLGRPVVLIDAARDLATTPLLVLSLSHPTDEHVRRAAVSVARRARRAALIVPDRPGGIVLRTLAQLANAAADALVDGVATASGIDEAMVAGANHPERPLGWARRSEAAVVIEALRHIEAETGDALYAPSPGLAHVACSGTGAT